jgi:REP element-mobilizing transposase RayT
MARSKYKILNPKMPHFLTMTVVNWIPIFSSPTIAQIILNSLQFLQKENRLILFAYVIMENHLHLIAQADDLSKEIGDFKSYTARTIIDYLVEKKAENVLEQLKWQKLAHKQDRNYQLWQEGSHPQMLVNEEMLKQKLDYIHMNPVKRGYVDEPQHWRYSSARNYLGQGGVIAVTTD